MSNNPNSEWRVYDVAKQKQTHADLAYMFNEAKLVDVEQNSFLPQLRIRQVPLEKYSEYLSVEALDILTTPLPSTVIEYYATEDGQVIPPRLVELIKDENTPTFFCSSGYKGIPFEKAFANRKLWRRASLVQYLAVKTSLRGNPQTASDEQIALFAKLFNRLVQRKVVDFGVLCPMSILQLAPYHAETGRIVAPNEDGQTFRNTIFNVSTPQGYGHPEKDLATQRAEYDEVKDQVISIEDVMFQELIVLFVGISDTVSRAMEQAQLKEPIEFLNQCAGTKVFINEGGIIEQTDWNTIKELVS